MSKCRACGATIFWVQTPLNKYIPCDEGLVPYWADQKGTERVVTDAGAVITCWLDGDQELKTGLARIPHWATCTNPDKFRKKKNGS